MQKNTKYFLIAIFILIGSRSFSNKTYIIKKLGSLTIDLYNNNKIGTVIKHIPGHGLSTVDSHKNLPYVNETRKYLIKKLRG